MLCLDTTMLRKFENDIKKQNKKNLRLKIYGKIRNLRVKLEPTVLTKQTCRTETFDYRDDYACPGEASVSICTRP